MKETTTEEKLEILICDLLTDGSWEDVKFKATSILCEWLTYNNFLLTVLTALDLNFNPYDSSDRNMYIFANSWHEDFEKILIKHQQKLLNDLDLFINGDKMSELVEKCNAKRLATDTATADHQSISE